MEEAINEKTKKNVFKKKEIWISGLVGLVIGGLLIYLLSVFGVIGAGSKAIATFKGGKITGNKLYEEMKKYYPISYVLELVDKPILDKKYELTDEQQKEINDEADSILSMYATTYGYTEEEFFSANGFATKEEFIDYLKLDYERNLYCIDYFKTMLDESQIQDYYDNNVYGEVNTKHILVQTSDSVSEEDALALANEIIEKLNSGSNFDDLVKEYEDKVVSEDVDFDNFTAQDLESEYVTAAKDLEKGSYTKEAVKTDYGYHVIYVTDKEDKPSLEEVENDIVEKLGEDLEADDQYIRYKALIKMREESGLKFKEETMQKQYEEYCEEVNPTETNS